MRARESERGIYRQKEGDQQSACMKLGAFDHPKTLTLKSILKCSYPCVIGHLELLWKFTAQHSPRGNLGKWPDSAIASACGWEGEASEFCAALVAAGYVDTHPSERFVVHDWKEHCPQWVRAQLAKSSLTFVSTTTTELSSVASSVSSSEPSTIPSLAKPSQESKNKIAPDGAKERFSEKKERPPDLLWEAMIEVCGLDGGTPTDRERKAWNGAVKSLRSAGATPGEIRARARCYRARWPGISLTPTALARRWTECVAELSA